ncbi:MAG: CCA tRNA nucleotidyltransferase [Candidatus Omnitrophica bacterium]|nr:CCA tRNA nucleotidyltransferase [Candidatus Omnitrophota bacterium]
MQIKDKVASIPYLFSIKRLANEMKVNVYLVGGFLRDLYLKRGENFDFDFIVERNAEEFSIAFSQKINCKWIVLDKEERTYRVIVKRKENAYHYDFSQLKGSNLEEDLLKRDFSINTLLLNVNRFPHVQVIDRLKAIRDLRKKIIRAVSEEVILEDPLRILRAFSLWARYNLRIETQTLKFLKKHKALLKKVSPERINEELFKILDSHYSYSIIKKMSDLFILDEIIPSIRKSRGVYQGGYHHLDVWEHSLQTLSRFEILYRRRLVKSSEIVDYLNQELAKNRKRIHILKLACLLHDIGKPFAKGVKGKKTIFHTHEKIGAELAQEFAQEIKLSVKEKEVLRKLIFWHLRPGYLAGEIFPSQRAIYRFFRDTEEEGVSVILLSLADWRATRGPLTNREKRLIHERVMFKLIDFYFNERKKKPLPKVVDGFDIMKKFSLAPSPLVGEILAKIREEQALGNVKNKREAYRVAKAYLESRREERCL